MKMDFKFVLIGILLERMITLYAEDENLFNENTNNFSKTVAGIKDPFVKYVIEKQLWHCPNVTMCDLRGRPYNYSEGIWNVPCCAPTTCKCNHKHGTNDRDSQCPNSRDTAFSCLRPQIKKFKNTANGNTFTPSDSVHGYLMVSQCPLSSSNLRLRHLCEMLKPDNNNKRTHDRDLYSMAWHIPVSNILTNVTYRNIYCAQCHDINTSLLYQWDAKVVCHDQYPINVDTIPNLLRQIINEDDHEFNVIFDTKDQTFLHKCAETTPIFECNTTGHWKTYDTNIERACLFYESQYKMKYRNIFCAMCNGDEHLDIECNIVNFSYSRMSKPTGFQGTLHKFDMHLDMLVNGNETKACDSQTKFDPLEDQCRNITCPHPLKYQDSTCRGFYKSVNIQKYEIYMTTHVYSEEICMERCANNVTFSSNTILNYIIKYLSKYPNTSHCQSDIAGMISNGSLTIKGEVYYVIRTIFLVNDFHNEVSFVERFLNDIRGTTFTPSLVDSDLLLTIDISPPGRFNTETTFIQDNVENRLLPILAQEMNPSAPCGGTSILTFRISSSLLCPMINISTVNTSYSNESLCIRSINLCVNMSQFEKHPTYFLVCEQPYFQKLFQILEQKEDQKTNNTFLVDVDPVIVYVCVSLSCFFSCIAFIVSLVGPRFPSALSTMHRILLLLIFLLNVVFVYDSLTVDKSIWCITSGYISHFLCVLCLAWLKVCIVHIVWVSRRLSSSSKSLRPSNKRLACYICYALGNAIVLILITFVYFYQTSSHYKPFVSTGYLLNRCYFSPSYVFLYTMFTPLAIHTLTCLGLIIANVFLDFKYNQTINTPFVKYKQDLFRFYCKLTLHSAITTAFGVLAIYFEWHGDFFIFLVYNAALCAFCMVSSFVICYRNGWKSGERQSQGYGCCGECSLDKMKNYGVTSEIR